MMSLLLISDVKKKLSEQELIHGLKAGIRNAHESLYEMYAGSLYGIISRIVIREEDAEDVLQETFVRIWKAIRFYDSEKGRLFTWMAKVAKNAAMDHLKGKSYKKSQLNTNLEESQFDVNGQHNVECNYDTIGIREITNKLPVPYQAVLELIYFKGFTHQEAAKELNLPLGTVKTRLRMAIQDLRKLV
ncbi:MAG: sigma-70 family RNA polymerase sigma factor [Daejeonella sp.]|uniref:RNA polymerase sigma factor n=1 Tax=Daejeonella sp. TaxID=2805397 RepID=UPI003C739412